MFVSSKQGASKHRLSRPPMVQNIHLDLKYILHVNPVFLFFCLFVKVRFGFFRFSEDKALYIQSLKKSPTIQKSSDNLEAAKLEDLFC